MLRSLIALRDLFLTGLVLVVASPMWLLPWRLAIPVGALYGAIGSLFWATARRASMINLKRAFPELSRGEARSITLRVFMNMGRSIAEGIQCSRRGIAACVHEDEDLAARIHADPRPKIFATAHLGSWELALMAARVVMKGNGAVIARAVDNPFLDAIVRKIRFDHATQRIEKRGAIAEALARLRAGESVAMLVDENGGPRGPHLPFFGRPASTRKTAALLSVMTGAPIVVGIAARREHAPFLFRLEVLEPAGATIDDVPAMTARINEILERWIREDLDQWRWLHWRWKMRPDGREERYTRGDLNACFSEALIGIETVQGDA